MRRAFRVSLKALVPLSGCRGPLSRHGVKMASKGHCPGYSVCSRMGQTGEVGRASGDKGSGGTYLSHPPDQAGPGVEGEGGNDSEALKH